MSKFYIVQVDYSDNTSEFEVRMKTESDSIVVTTRDDLVSAQYSVRVLEGKQVVNRRVVE